MRNRNFAEYVSDLERELESELREQEAPVPGIRTHDFNWKDAKGESKVTRFTVRESDDTATIVPPEKYWVKDQAGNLKEEKGSATEFTTLRRNAAGTRVMATTKRTLSAPATVDVTFTVELAGDNSKLVSTYRMPLASKDTRDEYRSTQAEAQRMIDFAKTWTDIPILEGEIGMRELDEELMDEEDRETYDEEFDLELDEEYGGEDADEELLSEYETTADDDEDEDNEAMDRFGRRLYEISQREFESEAEVESAIGGALQGVEEEYFTQRVKRKRKRGKGKKIFGNILKAGAKLVGKVASKLPIGSLIKAGTSLVRGNVKGALANLGKAAVGTVGTALLGPAGGALATSAMDAIGGGDEPGEGEVGHRRRRRRMAIRRVARVARDAYKELADNIPQNVDNPYVAHEVARKVVRRAMVKHGMGPVGAGPDRAEERDRPGVRRVVRVRPGETLIIKA